MNSNYSYNLFRFVMVYIVATSSSNGAGKTYEEFRALEVAFCYINKWNMVGIAQTERIFSGGSGSRKSGALTFLGSGGGGGGATARWIGQFRMTENIDKPITSGGPLTIQITKYLERSLISGQLISLSRRLYCNKRRPDGNWFRKLRKDSFISITWGLWGE